MILSPVWFDSREVKLSAKGEREDDFRSIYHVRGHGEWERLGD